MNKRFLLLIALALLLMASGPAYSQQAFRHSASRQTWRLPYTGYFPQKTNFGNDILEELARDLLKPPQFVNLAVNFTDEILLRSEQPSYWTAIVNFSDFRLSGYCQYRSFPMSDVLLPSGFRFALRFSTKLDTGNLTVREFNAKDPLKGNALTFRVNGLPMDTAVDTLIAGNFSFDYSETCWQKFYAKKNLVDDYYASAAMIDSLDTEVQNRDMRDPPQLPFNYIRLSELVRILDLVNSRDFGNRLIKGGGDPRNLSEKTLALYKISRTCIFNLRETLEKSGPLPGYGSLDTISDYFIESLMRYIRLSSLMDDIQGMIYPDYLNTYYSKHVYDSDSDFVQAMLARMFPAARPDTLLSYASESLMKAYKKKAASLMSSRKYSDAVMLIENARSMAAGNPYLKNHNGWEGMMSEAVNGIYNSYAGIASSSLEGGNTSFAMEYLQKAEKYREQYPVFITSDSVYRRVYRAIFLGQIENCSRLLGEGNYSDALECLNSCEVTYQGRAYEILAPDIGEMKIKARKGLIEGLAARCMKALRQSQADSALSFFDRASAQRQNLPDGSHDIKAMDSLAPLIAVIRVKKINSIAAAYFRQRQFSRAILQFEQAGKIASAYSIAEDTFSDSPYHQSYKQWLLDRISREQQLIWNNKSDSAGGFLKLAAETARSKGLESDPDIIKALALYSSKIGSHNCELMEDSLELYNIRAGRCFAIHNFNRGVMVLLYAMRQAGNMGACSFNLTAMQDSVKKYRDAADYQNNLEEVTTNMIAGEYERGMQLLAANEKLYSSRRIDHFGISLTSVYDYVMMKSNRFITEQALEYYIASDDPVEAMRYMILLHIQGIPEDRSSMYQEKLALSLAAKDKLAYKNADPQSILRRYTASNSWMGRFSEAYIQAWKK